jgi:hypothetical protein
MNELLNIIRQLITGYSELLFQSMDDLIQAKVSFYELPDLRA